MSSTAIFLWGMAAGAATLAVLAVVGAYLVFKFIPIGIP